MAKKSQPFFVRANVDCAAVAGTFDETAVDLGFAIDALGSTIARILSIQADFSIQGNFATIPFLADSNAWGTVCYQLTTQSQTTIVAPSDKSLIASGKLVVGKTGALLALVSNQADRIDLTLNEGYLVGVETIYLGIIGNTSAGDFTDEPRVDLVLEMVSETMTPAKAMALSLSQQ